MHVLPMNYEGFRNKLITKYHPNEECIKDGHLTNHMHKQHTSSKQETNLAIPV